MISVTKTEVGKTYNHNEYGSLTRVSHENDGDDGYYHFVNRNYNVCRLHAGEELWDSPFQFDAVNLNANEYHRNETASEFFHDGLLPNFTDLGTLSVIVDNIHERMKTVAAEYLKPGSDEVIEDLGILDYIWGLKGDRWRGGGKPAHFYAVDYYLGRKVSHVWGTGRLVRFIKEDEKMTDIDREYFGPNLVVAPNLVAKGRHHGIELDYPCSCGKKKYRMYAIPGVHLGGFAYLIREEVPDNLFDVRNHCMVCDECGPEIDEQNRRIKEARTKLGLGESQLDGG